MPYFNHNSLPIREKREADMRYLGSLPWAAPEPKAIRISGWHVVAAVLIVVALVGFYVVGS